MDNRDEKPKPTKTSTNDMFMRSLKNVIAEQRKTDPLIGMKLGGKEVANRLIQGLKNEKGVHAESLLCALGSLAGYACQASVREEFVRGGGLPENAPLAVVQDLSGQKYFFGDALNKPLAEDKYSIWSLAAGAAQHLGAKELVDLEDLFKHVSATVGYPAFGIPRIPEGHTPGDLPINWLRAIWPSILPIVNDFCESPSEWPILFGFAIQDVLDQTKDIVDPSMSLKIVMESAVPMSKVDLHGAFNK